MIIEKVAKLLAEYKGSSETDITLDTTFANLGLDSLDIVDLVMRLEEEFNISIEVDEKLQSVRELVELIKAQTDGGEEA